MSTQYIDFVNWDFYDAPLKTLVNVLQINQEFRDGIRNGFVGGLTPERYNKISFAYRPANSGRITSEYLVEGTDVNSPYYFTPIAIGATPRPNQTDVPTPAGNFLEQKVIDPVYYCITKRVDEMFSDVSKLVEYNPYFFGAYGSLGFNENPNQKGGAALCCKAHRDFDYDTRTETTTITDYAISKIPNLADWIIVDFFQLYDVLTEGNYPRAAIASGYTHNVNEEGTSPKFVCPVVCYTGGNYNASGKNKNNYNQQYFLPFGNALFAYNPAAWNPYTDTNQSNRSLGSFGMSALFNCYYWSGIDELSTFGINHYYCQLVPPRIIAQSYPNDMIIIGEIPNQSSLDGGYSLKPHTSDIDVDSWAIPTDGNHPVYIAFSSWEFVEKLSRDFGIYVSRDLNTVKNTPIDYFPDIGQITPDPTIPPTGFPQNPTNPNIPNFPDNTTDEPERPIPNVTPLSIANVYALNLGATKAFFNWLLTDDFIKNLSELFNDKLSAINDLKLLPFDIVAHDTEHVHSQEELTLANVSTVIPNYKVDSNYNSWFFGGEYHYTAYWGDYNDFEATSFSLYVPYAGVIDLNPSDVINKTIQLWYAVDLNTGNGTVFIYSGNVVVRTLGAQLSISVPIISSNVNEQRRNEALTAINVGNSVAHGAIASIASGNPIPLLGSMVGGLSTTASTIMNNSYQIQRSGTFSSSTSLLAIQTPFLIISRQQIAIPDITYKNVAGMPSSFYGKLSQFVGGGFVSVKAEKLKTSATADEQTEIVSLLNSGIYI